MLWGQDVAAGSMLVCWTFHSWTAVQVRPQVQSQAGWESSSLLLADNGCLHKEQPCGICSSAPHGRRWAKLWSAQWPPSHEGTTISVACKQCLRGVCWLSWEERKGLMSSRKHAGAVPSVPAVSAEQNQLKRRESLGVLWIFPNHLLWFTYWAWPLEF